MAHPKEQLTLALDPYLEWAGLTNFKYLAYGQRDLRVFALEANDETALAEIMALRGVRLRTTPTSLKGLTSPFVSVAARNPTRQLLNALRQRSNFVLAEPGMRAVQESVDASAPHGMNLGGRQPAPCNQDVVFAVIDGRCAFANASFCDRADPRSSLIDYFWDQGVGAQANWRQPRGVTYGREMSKRELSAALRKFIPERLARCAVTRGAAEKVLYRALGQALPTDCDWSHGTHILDTIITDFNSATRGASTQRPGIIYVQLPDEALRDTSGRWMAAHVVDALHYVLQRTRETSQVVVNLSLGAFAGPHDGTSILERAIDSLVAARHGRLAVVVAAGNARKIEDDSTGELKSCHSRVELAPKGRSGSSMVELEVEIDSQDSTETFLELWLRSEKPSGRPAVSVSLLPPRLDSGVHGTRPADEVDPGYLIAHSENGEVVGAVINNSGQSHAPNGSGAMVLVAIARTRNARGGARAQTGTWKVIVKNQEREPVFLDAFIERRDIPGELQGERPQYGFSRKTSRTIDLNSLCSLANGKRTVVVGAADRAGHGDYRQSEYSSVGTPGNRPTAVAAVPIVFAEGQREAAGFLSGSRKTLRGTSMAAAQVTAALGAASASTPKPKGKDRGRGDPSELIAQVREQAADRQRRVKGGSGRLVDASNASAFVLPAINSRVDSVDRSTNTD